MPVRTGVELLPAQAHREEAEVLENHAARMIAALSE